MAGASGVWQQQLEGQVSLERKTRTLGAKLTPSPAGKGGLRPAGKEKEAICPFRTWACSSPSAPAMWAGGLRKGSPRLPCGRTEPGKVRGCAWSYAQAGDPAFERVMSSL